MITKGCSKTMNNVWPEEDIRKKLKRFDTKTRLNGADYPSVSARPSVHSISTVPWMEAHSDSPTIIIRPPHGPLKRHLTPFGMNMRTT